MIDVSIHLSGKFKYKECVQAEVLHLNNLSWVVDQDKVEMTKVPGKKLQFSS